MKSIPAERKASILAKMTGPDRKPIAQLAAEEGLSTATLYNWRKAARTEGQLLPDHDDSPEGWSSRDKFNAVLETAALSESQLSEYCRRHGLYPEQIARWRKACAEANNYAASERAHQSRLQREERSRIRRLESELRRKEKALAETAALLVLRKKAEAIWGEEDA
jgi:transposase-like protein